LAVGVIGFLLSPLGRQIAAGFVRGEAFYKGRPASYWRELLKKEINDVKVALRGYYPHDSYLRSYYYSVQAYFFAPPPLPRGDDPKAVPVILKLLNDENEEVMWYAVWELTRCEPDYREVVIAILNGFLDHESARLRDSAAHCLMSIIDKDDFSLTMMLKLAKDKDVVIRASTISSLGKWAVKTKIVIPTIIEAMRDENPTVRESAKEALDSFRTYYEENQKEREGAGR
jgi:hypothetical protein